MIPVNPEPLRRIYGEFPSMDEFRLRSINLDVRGPSLALRVDLPDFPAHPPEDWAANECDVVQCQIHFAAVEPLDLQAWSPPTMAQLTAVPTEQPRMLDVSVDGPGVSLRFRSHESVAIRHISAFRATPDASDEVPHRFLSKVDARLFSTLPGTHERLFYER
ncbi:Imm50 family immunity protein [Streptomyces sp. NBC_00006]|uniref:Imm50 family immunity protein n=1 Tax=Streptomyces sp. NBC_00006 TaxID=2975619 RepID=UPI002B1DC2EA|nr:Imm50 family immunity protein [Streptomyces sp. NBC_00006]